MGGGGEGGRRRRGFFFYFFFLIIPLARGVLGDGEEEQAEGGGYGRGALLRLQGRRRHPRLRLQVSFASSPLLTIFFGSVRGFVLSLSPLLEKKWLELRFVLLGGMCAMRVFGRWWVQWLLHAEFSSVVPLEVGTVSSGSFPIDW